MTLSDQCCTLPQSKRLKELGVTATAIWYWVYPSVSKMLSTTYGIYYHEQAADIVSDNDGDEFDHDSAAAFSVAELSVMLPDYYPSWRFEVTTGGPKKWIATVICQPKPPGIDDIHTANEFDRMGDTQAEALATLLIALLETGTITPEEVNNRVSK